jgi:hypothetical protein
MAWLVEVCGWLGAFVILAAYGAFSIGLLHDGWLFQAANLAGAAAMLVNGAHHGAWPNVVTSGAWCLIGVVALVRLKRRDQPPVPSSNTPGADPGTLLPPVATQPDCRS